MDLTGTKRKSNANVQSADVSKERNNGLSRQVTVKTLPRVNDTDDLIESINRHLFGTQLKDRTDATTDDIYVALALSLRDQMAQRWIRTQRRNREHNLKHVYYLSMEFYLGRFLRNTIANLGMDQIVDETLKILNVDKEAVFECEPDAGLGNGGLGRLAACFLDSMANLNIPCYGYGLLYEYGIFKQTITVDGDQRENADDWLQNSYVWDIVKDDEKVPINFYGEIQNGKWVKTQVINAVPHDIPVPGYKNNVIQTLRLWKAQASSELSFEMYNTGDYVRAVEQKNEGENITRVLYPDDSTYTGKELRLKQEYFLVAASIRDILRRHIKTQDAIQMAKIPKSEQASTSDLNSNIKRSVTVKIPSDRDTVIKLLENFAEKNAIQLNDTHPALAIPEILRIFLDEYELTWEEAWKITRKSFNYTNHTVLPEALEKWPVYMIEKLLPRHLQIIYSINHQFLLEVSARFKNSNQQIIENMSVVQEFPEKAIRMSNLAIVGSSKVNGVAAMHSELIKRTLFKNFVDFYKCVDDDDNHFLNVTNGVTPRRWILEANQELSQLITQEIGHNWVTNLLQLKGLERLKTNANILQELESIKHLKKQQLAHFLKKKYNFDLNPDWMLSIQVKRIHEYKRQFMNLLHVVILYNRILSGEKVPPRTVMIGGKAAPSYSTAKLIIKLTNKIAKVIDNDERVNKTLKFIFVPNYDVSSAEVIIPAADLSEQISLAGLEASGTSNMKFMMNGALTIGTMDGANVEIREAVGDENIFTFGMLIEDVSNARQNYGREIQFIINSNEEISKALNMIDSGYFFPEQPHCFSPLINSTRGSDYYMVLKDLMAYVDAEEKAAQLYYNNKQEWFKKALINIANSGRFSSDEAIINYAEKIWKVEWNRDVMEH